VNHALNTESVLIQGVILPGEADLKGRIVGAGEVCRGVRHGRPYIHWHGVLSAEAEVVGNGESDDIKPFVSIHMGNYCPGIVTYAPVAEVPGVGDNRTVGIVAAGGGERSRICSPVFRSGPFRNGHRCERAGVFIGSDIRRTSENPVGVGHIQPVGHGVIVRQPCVFLNFHRVPCHVILPQRI